MQIRPAINNQNTKTIALKEEGIYIEVTVQNNILTLNIYGKKAGSEQYPALNTNQIIDVSFTYGIQAKSNAYLRERFPSILSVLTDNGFYILKNKNMYHIPTHHSPLTSKILCCENFSTNLRCLVVPAYNPKNNTLSYVETIDLITMKRNTVSYSYEIESLIWNKAEGLIINQKSATPTTTNTSLAPSDSSPEKKPAEIKTRASRWSCKNLTRAGLFGITAIVLTKAVEYLHTTNSFKP